MKVLILHIDGLGYDYLNNSDLNFTKSLSGCLYRMKIYPGYFSNEASLFTGLKDKQHNMEDLFVLNPEASPFNKLTSLLPNKVFRYLSRLYGYQTYIHISPPSKNYFKLFVPVTKDHPYNFNNSFPAILKKHGLKFKYLNSLNTNLKSIKKEINENDCVYAIDLTYDHILHEYGPKFKAETRIDQLVKDITSFLVENYKDNFTIILLSDHGMVEVKDVIPYEVEIEEEDIYFADSTILRIWNNDPSFTLASKNAELLEQKKIDGKYYRRYVAQPGYIFSPNFFQGRNFIIGMHGYKSTNSPHDAFLVIHNPKSKKQYTSSCSIIDVAPTILNLFKIDKLPTMTGRIL